MRPLARLGATVAVAAAWVACGARSTLRDDGGDAPTSGEGGAGASGPATSTAAGEGGASSSGGAPAGAGGEGVGGGELACARLVWAGPPVAVAGLAHVTRSPAMARLDGERVAVAYVDAVSPTRSLVRHLAVTPWGAWPPEVLWSEDFLEVGDDASLAVAAIDGERFAFAAAADASNVLVGSAQAGSWMQVEASVVRVEPQVRWLTGPLGDGHLVLGHGPDDVLVAELADRESGVVTSLGALGCTAAPLASDAIRVGGAAMIASANGTAFDDCLDPDAPEEPRVVQTVTVREGVIETRDAIDAGGRVEDVQISPRDGGAWLAWRTDAYVQIAPVTEEGTVVASGVSFGVPREKRLAIAGAGSGLALVTAGPAPDGGGSLAVQLLDARFGHVAATAEDPPEAITPRDVTVLASDDHRSFLIAVEDEYPQGRPIVLLRADCAP